MEELVREEAVQEEPAEVQALPEERDYQSEVRALWEARPELRGQMLPDAVAMACVGGKRLTDAYNDFAKAQKQETENLRKENRVLRQNARSAAQAPVRGVSRGGSVSGGPEDPFLKGFNAGW